MPRPEFKPSDEALVDYRALEAKLRESVDARPVEPPRPTHVVDFTGAYWWGRIHADRSDYLWHIVEGGSVERTLYRDDTAERAEATFRYHNVYGAALCKPSEQTTWTAPPPRSFETLVRSDARDCRTCTRRAKRLGITRSDVRAAVGDDAGRTRHLTMRAARVLDFGSEYYRPAPTVKQLREAADALDEVDADTAADLRRLATDYEAAVRGIWQRIEESLQ